LGIDVYLILGAINGNGGLRVYGFDGALNRHLTMTASHACDYKRMMHEVV
jgi:hypothetical protein